MFIYSRDSFLSPQAIKVEKTPFRSKSLKGNATGLIPACDMKASTRRPPLLNSRDELYR